MFSNDIYQTTLYLIHSYGRYNSIYWVGTQKIIMMKLSLNKMVRFNYLIKVNYFLFLILLIKLLRENKDVFFFRLLTVQVMF